MLAAILGSLIMIFIIVLAYIRLKKKISLGRQSDQALANQYLFKPIFKNQKNIGTVISFQDISERLQAEEKIRFSEDNFRFALKAADASYWHYDWLHDQITVDVHGYGEDNMPKTMKEFLSLVHPDDQKRVENAMLHHFRNDVPFLKVDYRFLNKKTGKWIWLHSTGRPVEMDEQGRPIAVSGLTLDITNRQTLLEEVKTSQERLHIISEHTYDWQSWQDLDGKLLWVNKAVERITGYPVDECTTMGNYPIPLIDEHDSPLFENIKKEALGGAARQEKNLRIRKKDGGLAWVSWSMEPVRNPKGRIIGIASVAKDITRQKEARQALRLMSKVFEDSIDPIFIVNHETRKIINFNEAAVSAYGYSRKELLGGYIALVTPESLIEQTDVLYNRCVAGEICRNIEWQRREKNGEIQPVLLSLSLLKDEDGKIHGIASMARNISELKQAEQELKDYGDHLEDLVRERTAGLVKAMKIAKEATKAKSSFLANISHEISTPLNAIVGFVHLALQTGLTSRQRDYLTKIQKSTKSLLNIINDILDFSKIEAAKLTLEVTEFYLGEVLDTVTNLIDIKAREKGLELVFNIEPQIPQALTGDPLRLSQVLINLIGNAVKFTDHGQILLSCCLVKNNEDSVELEFSIQDSGVGLTQEQQNRLFQAFSQADTSTTREYGGTGLGLSISKNLVKMMGGGRIQVQSQLGKGATFSFTVCLKKAVSLPTQGKKPVPDIESIRGARLLVAEDNSLNQQVIRDILEHSGVAVDIADNGRIALEMLKKNDYDGILMDINMPEMDGYTTTRRIRQIYGSRDLPIIALTGNTVPEDMEKALAAGMDDQVSKPIHIHTLLAVLCKWIRCNQHDRLAPQPSEIKPPFIENFEKSALPMLPGIDTRADQAPDSATVGQLLLNLQKLLARDDSRAGEVVQELTVFFPGTDRRTLFSLLSRQVCAYNYDDAAKTLGRLFQELDKPKGG